MTKKIKIPDKLQRWVEARKRFHLSHAQVQMARELGLNPRKLGGLTNHDRESWKLPLPQYLEHLYQKSFGKKQPDRVQSIEDRVRELAAKKAAGRERRLAGAEGDGRGSGETTEPTQPGCPPAGSCA